MQKQATVRPPPSGLGIRAAERQMKKALREFAALLNEEEGLSTSLKKPRGVALVKKRGKSPILVEQKKEHLQPSFAVVDGVRYARTYDGGNRAAESLVRANLAQFISETKRVVRGALERRELGRIMDICRSYEDGIRMEGFFSSSGNPLSKNRAFSEAIKQFFKDEALVLKVVSQAIKEHLGQLEGKKKAK